MSQQKQLVHIIGCRPHIIKFTRIYDNDMVCWTGQHYDDGLKGELLDEFGVKIDYDLSSTSLQNMIGDISLVLKDEMSDLVIVYGDTRSTLAGALAAKELNLPLAHIEAGVRTKFLDRYEERIRRSVDQMSDYLFAATNKCKENLEKEGVLGKIFMVGDTHYDEYVNNRKHGNYILCTIHRAEHVDNKEELKKIIAILFDFKDEIIFPIHPRTKKMLEHFELAMPNNVRLIPPVKHGELMELIKNAKLVFTDSGGLCKEAFYAGTPVETYRIAEWEEILGENRGNAKEKIRQIIKKEVLTWH